MIDIPTDMAVRLAKTKAAMEDVTFNEGVSSSNAKIARAEFYKAAKTVADDLIARNFHLMTEQIERLR